MILGIGTDLVSIGRFHRLLSKYGHDRIATRLFHPLEIAQCPKEASQQAQYYASRWAVKEAMVKALGKGGFSSKTVFLKKQMLRTRPISGADGLLQDLPAVKLSVALEPGSAMERYLHSIIDAPHVTDSHWKAHVSLSHEDGEFAVAFVVLESNTT